MALYNYTPNAYGYYEDDEEERRRREQEQAQAQQFGAFEPVKPVEPVEQFGSEPQPIKQTITYDPVTGEQRMKIEGSVQDLSAANPMTPTVSMPGQPAAEPVREMVQPADLVPETQPVQQPAQLPPGVQMVNGKLQLAPTTPVEPMTQAQAEMPAQMPGAMTQAQAEMPAREPMAMPQLPQPGPGVQVAGPAQMPPAAAPAAAPTDPISAFTSAVGDTNKLLQIYNDKSVDPELRRMAGREASRQLDAETKRVDAERKVSQMTPAEIAREMRSSSEEGSWTKRVLFGLLNMQGAMAQEDAKLGIGAKYQASIFNGEPVQIKIRADGKPMEGFNAVTRQPLTQRELVAAAANMATVKGTEVEAGTYQDPTGKVAGNWVLERRPGGSQYRQVGTGNIATEEQANALRKTGVQGTLGDQRARLIQEANIKLQGKTAEEQLIIQRQYNQLLVGQGLAPMQPSETPLVAPQIGGAAPPPPPPPSGAAAPAAAVLSPDQTARLQRDVESIDQELKRLPAGDNRRQFIQAERDRIVQQLGGAAPAVSTAPAALPTGRRPTQQELEARGAAGTAAATEVAKTAPLVRRADEESFIKFKNDEILPKADTGARLAGIRRDQISGPDGILNNPEIAGLLSGTGGAAREFQNLFRDVVGGNFEKIDDMSTRIKQANLDPRTKEVLQIQLQRQREVTPLLIREVAPVGTITDFEQRMAKEAGIDVLRQGLYSSLTNLTRSQFQSDMAAYKSVFAERNPQLRTRQEFDRAWNAEKSRLDASYRKVYEDRARYLGQYNRDGSNNNATIVAFRDHYPVPAFDQSTGQFRFGGFSRNAERAPLSSFERR